MRRQIFKSDALDRGGTVVTLPMPPSADGLFHNVREHGRVRTYQYRRSSEAAAACGMIIDVSDRIVSEISLGLNDATEVKKIVLTVCASHER